MREDDEQVVMGNWMGNRAKREGEKELTIDQQSTNILA
jgi:hypothetical protein